MAQQDHPMATVHAIKAILPNDKTHATKAAVALWNSPSCFENCKYNHALPAESIFPILIQSSSTEAHNTLRKKLPTIKHKYLRCRSANGPSDFNALNEQQKTTWEILLGQLLADGRFHERYSRPMDEEGFLESPAINELAASSLSKNWPTLYSFSFDVDDTTREKQIQNCAATWQKRTGEELPSAIIDNSKRRKTSIKDLPEGVSF